MAELVHDGKTRFSSPIPRSVLRDKRLRFGARGLFAFLWDLPTGWNIRLSHLEKMSASEGRDALRSLLRELEEVGALIIEPIRGESGRFKGKTWTIVSPDKWAIESPLSEQRVSPSSAEPNIGQDNTKVLQGRGANKKDEAAPAASRPKYGDEIITHGVEIWTESDKKGLQKLIDEYGAESIEEVADALLPAPGHRAPYLSAVTRAFSERRAKLKSDEAEAAQQRREEESIKNAPNLDELTDECIAQLPPSLRKRGTKK